MTTIILAEDQHLVREGIRILLKAAPGISVIGEEGDGLAAVALVEKLKPDVLVTDLMMPGLNGIEVTRQTVHRVPGTRVIILSMYSDEATVARALAAGASGYVQKEADASTLIEAINAVVAGQRYLSPPLTESIIEKYIQSIQAQSPDPYDSLSMREREIIQLVADGYTSAQIGEQLSISSRTVEVHRTNAMRKLGLHRQADVIRFILQRNSLPGNSNTAF